MNMNEFIAAYKITMTAESAPSNPNLKETDSVWDADHWLITLTRPNDNDQKHPLKFVTFFSQGAAYRQKTEQDGKEVMAPAKPKLDSVLSSIASDIESYMQAESYSEWRRSLGIHDKSVYKLVGVEARKFISFLGRPAVDQLIDDVERL